ncbi:L-arabinose transport system permease protein AraQ [Paenibacillus konkukensis]|uniref:L-arabinose transport system permease protein AraQ n=1 Tax=Paenibacillus konkukensis TaxID=2020716 RepID=A0ABY4RKQ3_9BACL|nr:carbohydrate ABC transporter permease [Paenibacillus konkukensis]UQZ82421.1 L-arabinose transport system permease protein AraQ [Paenibacillus konkukensis]
MKSRKKIVNSIIFVIVFLYACVSLYPLLWAILQSFKSEREFLTSIWSLPSGLDFTNFRTAFQKGNLATYFFNTVRNTAATLVVDLVFITLAGFAFAKMKMKFKKFLYGLILVNLLIPTPIILLPMYLLILDLHIQNSLAAIVFPYFQGFAPLGLILITNYFNNIPDEVIESARIDGCNTAQILVKMIVPLAKPILSTLTVLGGMSAWNEFMWALISISDVKKYTLSVGISTLNDKTSILGYTPVFAALTVSAMVFIVIYLLAQKAFVQSITAGAVKG